ncbi:MAG: hypothetical protein M3010_09115 [Candidatus Dormibacteraeota bacterium]|nr:hypothetical protein [Candidatus Dormibacteraeota bacterium]
MKTLLLPTGRIPRLLYSCLFQRGPLPQPARTVDGHDVYVLQGFDGASLQLALPKSDSAEPGPEALTLEMAVAALHRGATDDGALVLGAVVVSLLLALDGLQGQCRWQRFIEVIHGRGARPDRHNDPVKQLLALFVWARWSFERECATSPTTWTQLVEHRRITRSSATVVLDPGFHQDLAAVTYDAPVEEFLVGPPTFRPDPKNQPNLVKTVANPEGYLPSRRISARARVALLLEIAPRRPRERPKTELGIELEQFMARAGADLEPVKRRRHIQPWTVGLQDQLRKAAEMLHVGIVSFTEQLGSILRTVLHVGRQADKDDDPTPADPPQAGSGSRAPP